MTPLTIKSTRDGITLRLGPVRDRVACTYDAELQSPVVSGRVEVYDLHTSSLVRFFEDLATHWWQGWDGEKKYESLERHLCLVAARDALGHVSLEVVLRDAFGGADYEVRATLGARGRSA